MMVRATKAALALLLLLANLAAAPAMAADDGGKDAAAKDFCADAFGHCKFIGFSAEAATLFDAARIPEMDAGFVQLTKAKDAKTFVATCRALRYWPRELKVDLDAQS